MPTDNHSEIEYKFAADHVDYDDFVAWAIKQKPLKYESASFPDLYYEQDGNIVRHRWSGGAGELTVKQRKSADSIADRVEIDLRFSAETSVNDVTVFLQASGWKRLFTLFKDGTHVFWFQVPGGIVSVAEYAVEKLDEETQRCVDHRKFIEIEVEKGSSMSMDEAKTTLEKWRRLVSRTFNLTAPLNVSLYEMYSGRTYKTATKEQNDNGHHETPTENDRGRRPSGPRLRQPDGRGNRRSNRRRPRKAG